jgi:hypothetical protein
MSVQILKNVSPWNMFLNYGTAIAWVKALFTDMFLSDMEISLIWTSL